MQNNIIEIWMDMKNYSNYQISNFGRVFNKKFKKFLKGNITTSGYNQLCIRDDGKNIVKLLHRLVAEHFIPNPYNKPCVNHIDCNPSNNIFTNLEWVTQKENLDYARKLKRLNHNGSRNVFAILNEEQVLEIRFNSTYKTNNELASLYGVSNRCIRDILSRRHWKHI